MEIQEGQNSQAQQLEQLEQLASTAGAEDYQPTPEEVQAEEEAADQISTGELCTALLSVGFSLVAARRGDHWTLNEAEARETGNAVGAVLDKYFPDMNQHGPELTALMTVGAVLTPRLMTDKRIAIQHARQQAEQYNAQKAAEEAATAKEVPRTEVRTELGE